MMKSIQEAIAKRQNGDKGFTLVELLVVVVILVVLAAVAVPIFLNQRSKAVDAKAQTDLSGIASVLRNGQSVGATPTIVGNVASYTSTEAGDQRFTSSNTLTEKAGNSYAPGGTWCVSVTPSGGTGSFHITNALATPATGVCP